MVQLIQDGQIRLVTVMGHGLSHFLELDVLEFVVCGQLPTDDHLLGLQLLNVGTRPVLAASKT